MSKPDMDPKMEYLTSVSSAVSKQHAYEIARRRQTSMVSKPRALYHSHNEHKFLQLEDIYLESLVQPSEVAVIIVENIDAEWIAALGVHWKIESSFFSGHMSNPGGPMIWQSIFGNEPSKQRRPSQNKPDASKSTDHALPTRFCHVDGVFKFDQTGSDVGLYDNFSDSNAFPRRFQHCPSHGCSNLNTRISYYLVNPSLYLFLVDSPATRETSKTAKASSLQTTLHLPLSNNRGGLVLPAVLGRPSYSLYECFERFVSHSWHINVLFGHGKLAKALSPETLFYLMVTSTWMTNLQMLTGEISQMAFEDVRRPTVATTDRLHSARQRLATLRAEVSKAAKWIPAGVCGELGAVQRHLAAGEHVGFPCEELAEVLEAAAATDKLLMDTFQLLMSSVGVRHAETSVQQAARAQRLTQLAFVYLPLSFVTGVYGMNVAEINGAPLSVWVPVVTLAVTALATAGAVAGWKWLTQPDGCGWAWTRDRANGTKPPTRIN